MGTNVLNDPCCSQSRTVFFGQNFLRAKKNGQKNFTGPGDPTFFLYRPGRSCNPRRSGKILRQLYIRVADNYPRRGKVTDTSFRCIKKISDKNPAGSNFNRVNALESYLHGHIPDPLRGILAGAGLPADMVHCRVQTVIRQARVVADCIYRNTSVPERLPLSWCRSVPKSGSLRA